MPRGIPNAKRDESAMRFTSFHVPLQPNPKHMGSTYLKSESQTLWSRNAVKNAFNRTKPPLDDPVATPSGADTRRGSKVLVIHPGSRWLRIGRASDVSPVSVPNVIARKQNHPVTPPTYIQGISRPSKERERGHPSVVAQASDEYAVALGSDDPFDAKVAAITVSLRDRMRFYKLRVTTNAATVASKFNDHFKPEVISELNDPFRIDWIDTSEEQCLVGEKALRLADPAAMGYIVRWPVYGSSFNTRNYTSNQLILNDIEAILRSVLNEKLNIEPRSYKEYSVVLVIPDFYDRYYVEDLVQTLLSSMGFKQLCVQQESLAATYGAGISNACVVDMGATTTSIACVDDGLVIADTRMSLNMGGDDITEFLSVLLQKISFPYREMDLARAYDWNVMEDLKSRLCTLAEGDVALNLYDFVVRRPGKSTEKYGLRAYDEIILSPMCLFEPRVIEFENKRAGKRPYTRPDVVAEIVEQTSDHVTQAMMISTQHLLPSAVQPVTPAIAPEASGQPSEGANAATQDGDANADPKPDGNEEKAEEKEKDKDKETSANKEEDKMDTDEVDVEKPAPTPEVTITETVAEPVPVPVTAPAADDPMNSLLESHTANLKGSPFVIPPEDLNKLTHPPPPQPPTPQTFPGGFAIDVCFEASKLPLDVAIFNSARAAGGDEKIRKYLQAVLVVGGTALVPGMAHALESRLQAIATPLVPNMEKVQIIPPPKDVDPRFLAWKGAAVLGKMDGVADLWMTGEDWDIFGMRALKERCFYL